MANKQQGTFELKRLTRTMAKSLKNWKRPGGQPSVPDMAKAVEGWKSDLERLSIYDSLNSRSLQSAHRKMAKAWAHRDSRPDAIDALDEALNALEEVPAEMSVPEPVKTYKVRNIKSLYGEEIARQGYDPNVFAEIHEIRRQVEGFEMAPSTDHVDYTNVSRVKSALADLTEQYPVNSRVYQAGSAAVKSLGLAQAAINRPGHMRNHFAQAVSMIDEMGASADLHHSPVAYKAELSYGAEDVLDAIDDMNVLLYSQNFYEPQELVGKALKAINHIQNAVAPYYDPKTNRLVGTIKANLELVEDNLSDVRVKSIGGAAWQAEIVSRPYNEALNRLGLLEAHIRTLA